MDLAQVGEMRELTIEEARERFVEPIKAFRKEIDRLIQKVSLPYTKNCLIPSAYETNEAVSQVRIHLTNAEMWAGKALEALDSPFPPELVDKAE